MSSLVLTMSSGSVTWLLGFYMSYLPDHWVKLCETKGHSTPQACISLWTSMDLLVFTWKVVPFLLLHLSTICYFLESSKMSLLTGNSSMSNMFCISFILHNEYFIWIFRHPLAYYFTLFRIYVQMFWFFPKTFLTIAILQLELCPYSTLFFTPEVFCITYLFFYVSIFFGKYTSFVLLSAYLIIYLLLKAI